MCELSLWLSTQVHIPFEAEFRLPHTPETIQMVQEAEYLALVDRIKVRSMSILIFTHPLDDVYSTTSILLS